MRLKTIPYCLTEKQQIAVGAVLLWENCRGMSGGKHDKWLAITCIKLQTFY
jgi:hypothetical protein